PGRARPSCGPIYHLPLMLVRSHATSVSCYKNGPVGKLLDRLIKEVTVEFGIQNAVAPCPAHASRQQLVLVDMHGDVPQGLGPAQHQRLAFGLLERPREIQGTFNVYVRARSLEALQD